MSAGETEAHLALKRASLVWAQLKGYRACGLEVRVPGSHFRADAAAYRSTGSSALGETAIFECKQSRADYLRDAALLEESRAQLLEARSRLDSLVRLLGSHHPNLRRGETLFPEFDAVDLDSLEHEGLRKASRRVEALERKVFGGTKFDDLTRWRTANVFYLVVVPGIVSAEETPRGWGLLEEDAGGELVERKAAVRHEIPEAKRISLLEQIARKATAMTYTREGAISCRTADSS